MNQAKYQGESHYGKNYLRRGPSSFWTHDPEVVFDALALRKGDSFLDLGCGPGEYSIEAAKIIGDSGVVYALEKWAYMVDGLKQEAEAQGLSNLKPIATDITEPLPINNQSIDVCLLSTVLHMFDLSTIDTGLFTEVRRVLKPDGRVAVIECKKEVQPFGPPKHMRLSPEEVAEAIGPYGFLKTGYGDLGHNYMIQFGLVSG